MAGLRWTHLQAIAASLRYPELLLLPPRLLREMRQTLSLVRPSISPAGIFTHPYAPPIGGKPYARYLSGLRRIASGARVPLVVHLSITDRCGFHCLRCSNLSTSQADPPTHRLVALLRRLREVGAARVCFTGGEPTLREDLVELFAACKPDVSAQLFTSGQGVNPAQAQAWRKAGLDSALLSLDHYQKAVHDQVRGEGAHELACKALLALSQAGVHTTAQAVVSDELLAPGALERYVRFCIGLGAQEVMLLEPVTVNTRSTCQELTDLQREQLRRAHLRAAKDGSVPKVMSMSQLESGDFLGCQAGVTFMYIDTQGEVFPCDFVPLSFGNAHQENLRDLLARLTRCIPSPSCRCLARTLPGRRTGQATTWAETERLFRAYDPGPLPALMRWYERESGYG